MAAQLELGLDTFGDVTVDLEGRPVHPAQVVRDVVEEAVLADQVGLDFIGLGEHHREDFAISSPETVLAAIAARTERIRLGSAVTVLSSDDPIRVYERFATVDALSHGRAEVVLGRGSFTESFPLFGFDLDRYEELFEDKLSLFAEAVKEQPITWSGTTRTPLADQSVFPPTEHGLTTWIGVGGSPESVVRTARYGFGLFLAIIGGDPVRFRPYVDLFHDALEKMDQPSKPLAVHSPGFVADTDEQAREQLYEHFQAQRARIGAQRGWPAPTRLQFEQEASPHGSLYVGSPETVARKIVRTVQALGADRFDLKYSNGAVPHPQLMHGIELYGTKVAPMVRDMLAGS